MLTKGMVMIAVGIGGIIFTLIFGFISIKKVSNINKKLSITNDSNFTKNNIENNVEHENVIFEIGNEETEYLEE